VNIAALQREYQKPGTGCVVRRCAYLRAYIRSGLHIRPVVQHVVRRPFFFIDEIVGALEEGLAVSDHGGDVVYRVFYLNEKAKYVEKRQESLPLDLTASYTHI
jgi:hypothetical protein